MLKMYPEIIYVRPEPKTNSQKCCMWDIRKTREELEDEVCRTIIIIIIIIGIYIAPFPFIKCSKALHIVIV